jgi:hypothetical protein
MTAATLPGPAEAPTSNARPLADAGTFVKLNDEKKPNSFWAASDRRRCDSL